MEERLFFNPGDAIANDFDFQAARRSAEIFKNTKAIDKGLVVAKDDNGHFAVFYEAAASQDEKPNQSGKYTILAHL